MNQYYPASKFRSKILEILKTEGYINNFYLENDKKNKKVIKVNLKYYEGSPVIKEIKRISKPGRRVYSRANIFQKFEWIRYSYNFNFSRSYVRCGS